MPGRLQRFGACAVTSASCRTPVSRAGTRGSRGGGRCGPRTGGRGAIHGVGVGRPWSGTWSDSERTAALTGLPREFPESLSPYRWVSLPLQSRHTNQTTRSPKFFACRDAGRHRKPRATADPERCATSRRGGGPGNAMAGLCCDDRLSGGSRSLSPGGGRSVGCRSGTPRAGSCDRGSTDPSRSGMPSRVGVRRRSPGRACGAGSR